MTQIIDRTKEPPVKSFSTLSIPQYSSITLPNGIELYSLDAGDQPINRITVSFDSGMMEADIPDALIIAAQLLREGTASYSGHDISQTLDYHGAWLKCDVLPHNTTVNLWSLNKSTITLLPLLKELIFSPTFPQKEFTTLRDKHKARYLLSQKNVTFIAAQDDKKKVFGSDHPINRILDDKQIDRLTVDNIIDAYKSTFRHTPKVFVAGNIKELMPCLTEFFGQLDYTQQNKAQQIISPIQPLNGQQTSTSEVDAEHQAAIAMSIPTIDRNHEDYIGLRLVIMALGGYFGSRLMSNIREDKGYTYGIQANLLGYREGGVISIMTNTAPEYVDAVINEVKFELNRLREELMDENELSVVKNNAMTSLAAILDTPFSIMDHHISHFHMGTPIDYFAKQVKAINSLTPNEIAELSKKHINIDNLLISIAQPASNRTN